MIEALKKDTPIKITDNLDNNIVDFGQRLQDVLHNLNVVESAIKTKLIQEQEIHKLLSIRPHLEKALAIVKKVPK